MGGVKHDDGKLQFSLVPVSGIAAVAEILTFGAKKYEPRNWEKGLEWGRTFDALQRHLLAWWNGENLDPESGKSHLWHAACNLFFLIEFENTHPDLDNRPKKGPTPGQLVQVDPDSFRKMLHEQGFAKK